MSGHDRDGSLLLTSPSVHLFRALLSTSVGRKPWRCVGLDYMYVSFTSIIFNIGVFLVKIWKRRGWKIVLLLDGNSRGILFEFRNII